MNLKQEDADMPLWVWIFSAWLIGFVVTFVGHLAFFQMVMPGLAFFRALVWPIFWATGWPSGTPMPMD